MSQRLLYHLGIIFVLGFLTNVVWEHLHALLYVHYQGMPITSAILTRAALFDALIITLLSFFALQIVWFRSRVWLLALVALVFAILLERWALDLGRWVYTENMPIIPLINVGLTPTIQLCLLFLFSFKLSRHLLPR